MYELPSLLLIAAAFLLAGAVKGVIGLGLPTVSLALLTVTLGLEPAMALLLVPSFVTNLWQACVGGQARTVVARIWPLLVTATATVWIGAEALSRVQLALLSALLGVLLVVYSGLGLTRPKLAVPRGWEVWAGPLTGVTNGVLTGMTGSFVVPGVLYLQALGLSRSALMQAMGMLFTASTLALGLALGGQHRLSWELGALSALAVLPALLGMVLGQRLARRISEEAFRRLFFVALLILGAFIVARSLG